MTTYSLGRIVQHDPRSRAIEFRAAQAPLKSVSHRNWQKHPLDQGSVGGCVGWTFAQLGNTAPLRPRGRALYGNADGLRFYSRATQVDDFPGYYLPGDPKSQDTGTSGLAGAKAAQEAGAITAYHHAFGIDQALGALPLSPLALGIGWRDSMWEPDSRGYLDISGTEVGGHEISVIGLSTKLQRVTILNQWWNQDGTPWGRNGRAYLKFTDLDELLRAQGDVVVPVL